MAWRRRTGPSTGPSTRRRSGPAGESPWWNPADQRLAEQPLVEGSQLGRGWKSASMVNNAERLDPLGPDDDSAAVRAARRARVLTGLDEGRAWRHRDEGGLVVLRVEVFAEPDEADHRAAWQRHGVASLDATWRSRWQERGVEPRWIESRWLRQEERPDPLHAFAAVRELADPAAAVDWIRVEDHTDPGGNDQVTIYEHVTVWCGRIHVVATVRHDLALDVDDVVARAVVAVWDGVSSAHP